jgi:hypothetical protein
MPPALMTFHVRDRRSTPLRPLNAIFRFALELVALGLLGAWGHSCSTDPARRYLWLLAVPLLAATVWGTFTVANDPSRGKDGIEAAFFGCAIAACYAVSSATWAAAFGMLVCLHYATTLPRVRWLLAQR